MINFIDPECYCVKYVSAQFIEESLDNSGKYSIWVTPYTLLFDIFNALKSTKTGKACGVDGLAAEHFIHSSPIIHVYLLMLEIYLDTDDHQFGFKSQHATDMCIFTVKSVIK